MTNQKTLEVLLTDLFFNAKNKNIRVITEINKQFEEYLLNSRLPEDLYLELDKYRQSCVLALTLFKDNYDDLILDAAERLNYILKISERRLNDI